MHPAPSAGNHLPPLRIMHPQPPTQPNQHIYLPHTLGPVRSSSSLPTLPSQSPILPQPLPRFHIPSDTDPPFPQVSLPMYESHLPSHMSNSHNPSAPSIRNHFATPSHPNAHVQQIPIQSHTLVQTSQPSSHFAIPALRNIHPLDDSLSMPHHSAPITHQFYHQRPSSEMPAHSRAAHTRAIQPHHQPSADTRRVSDVSDATNPTVPMQTQSFCKSIYTQPLYTHVVSNPIAPGIRPLPPGSAAAPPHPQLAQQRPVQQGPGQHGPMQPRPVQPRQVQPRQVQPRPVQQRPVQQRPAQQTPVQQGPVQQRPIQQRPMQSSPAQRISMMPSPTQHRPIQQRPIQQRAVQQMPAQETSVQHRQVQPHLRQPVQLRPQVLAQGPHPGQPNAPRLSPVQKSAPVLPAAVSAPPATVSRDAAVEQYWRRLHALLTSARAFSTELQPDRTTLPRPEEIPRQIGYDLQGLHAHTADAHAAKQSEQYSSAYAARAAGDFMEYGVTSAHAVWVTAVLSEIIGSPSPKGMTDAPIIGTCPDRSVEDVRIRLFEAEVSCLPMQYVEELLKKRRAMRKFKHRIDLCVRILLALEGRGRRPAQATLDRAKLQLEKADMQARAEAERDAARKEKERLKNERVKKVVVKADDHKKRKRQQSAQANFMMRFIKKDDKTDTEAEDEVLVEARKGLAVPMAKDRDVMCVSWWLRAEMNNISLEKLEQSLKGRQYGGATAKEMLQHLSECAERRDSAERRIHVVLREFRQHRKMHTENRTPMFADRRADVRGRGTTGPVKLLQFAENHRPAFYGTFSRRSKLISGRRPLGKDSELDYECDSADEWDEDEEGEDLLDCEADKELASEEAELRKLYGSDDEDDDDFLDDADADDDDDDDGDGDENSNGSGPPSQEGPLTPKDDKSGTDVIDLTLVTVNNSRGDNKRPAKDDSRKRNGKRRKRLLKQSVVIYGVSIPDGEPSPLDRFAVNAFDGSQPIQMFNPFVYTSSDIVAEHLKAKPPSSRTVRASNMDESTKLDLAATLVKTGSAKDKIVLQFCEHRKLRGLAVPTKAVINRAIGEIAIKEKRNGDTRALWHLTDQTIAKKVAEMQKSSPAPFSRPSASVVVE